MILSSSCCKFSLISLSLDNYCFNFVIYSDYNFDMDFSCESSFRLYTAFLALLANCRVEKVSLEALREGLMHIINLINPFPNKESLNILVSLEFLNGMWLLDFWVNADIQNPREDKLLLILINSWVWTYFYYEDKSIGILNF